MCSFIDQSFKLWGAIFETQKPFSNFVSYVVFGETLIPKGAHRPWNHFLIVSASAKLAYKLLVKSCFILGDSFIQVFLRSIFDSI